jgi:hypothetical protein
MVDPELDGGVQLQHLSSVGYCTVCPLHPSKGNNKYSVKVMEILTKQIRR